jgi:hypothetical protein
MNPRPTAAEVIDVIRAAFAGVSREDGVSLHEAEVIDCYGGVEERAQARKLDKDQAWEQIPAADIEEFSNILSFMDPKGFRYIAPYMLDPPE